MKTSLIEMCVVLASSGAYSTEDFPLTIDITHQVEMQGEPLTVSVESIADMELKDYLICSNRDIDLNQERLVVQK